MRRPCLMFLLWYLSGHAEVQANYYTEESALRKAIIDDTQYEYKIRPARKVDVQVRLSLLNINILDAPSQRLSVSGWLTFNWWDSRLSWNQSQYGNITDIFDTELVFWRPEIIVDNSVDNLGILESDKLLIRATSEGNMTWEPPGIYETHCDVDVTFYPFDTQICVVEVTSWAHTMDEIELSAETDKIDLAEFKENGEWDTLGSWTEKKKLHDGPDVHTEIAFSIKLQRKPMYYVTTILIPVIVTSILCIVVFLLPVESGERVGYSLTILLTYTVMLTLVASYMPPTSKHTSVLGVYLTIILFIGVVTTLMTVVVIHLHHHPQGEGPPAWLQVFTRCCMLPISGWRPTKSQHLAEDLSERSSDRSAQLTRNLIKVQPTSKSYSNKVGARHNPDSRNRDTAAWVGGPKEFSGYINDRDDFSDHRYDTRKRKLSLDNMADVKHNFTWREVSAILDKVCLRILGGFVVTLTIVVLLTMVIGGRLLHIST